MGEIKIFSPRSQGITVDSTSISSKGFYPAIYLFYIKLYFKFEVLHFVFFLPPKKKTLCKNGYCRTGNDAEENSEAL